MPAYNFTRLVTMYLVDGATVYDVPLYPGTSFAQTFSENQQKKKTLHNPERLDGGATITSANPANFSFTTPVTNQALLTKLLALATPVTGDQLANFTLYISYEGVYYKLTKCVLESIAFNIEKNSVVTLTISGTASRLDRQYTSYGITATVSKGSTYIKPGYLKVIIGGTTLVNLSDIHIDIANSVSWRKEASVHNGINQTIAYPYIYTLESRHTSGSITQFLNDITGAAVAEYSVAANMSVDIYSNASDTISALSFTLPKVVFTKRSDPTKDFLISTIDFKSLT